MLRGHVVRRAEELARGGEVGAAGGDLGDAEVGDLGPQPFEQDDVGRLDVAVDDPLRVGEVERFGDLGHDVPDLVEVQRPPLRERFLQVLPFDVLHGDEGHASGFVLTDVVHGHDGRVVQDSRGLGLADEALLELLRFVVVGVSRRADRLQGDQPPDQRILGQVDDSHRPFAKLAYDLVAAELHLAALSARVGRSPISGQ